MKKFIFTLLLLPLFAVSLPAQDDDVVYFFGIDYSQVKAYGVDEGITEFADAFTRINVLMTSEADKYDFSRAMRRRVINETSPMVEQSRSNTYNGMLVYKAEVPELDIAPMVKAYSLPEDSGTGLILIARILDKPAGVTAFDVVVFDIASREIILNKRAYGECGGFGLRNYWARSVYDLTKDKRLFKELYK